MHSIACSQMCFFGNLAVVGTVVHPKEADGKRQKIECMYNIISGTN